MLAAQQVATETWFCTFTYGGGYENEDAYWLDYSDLQKALKKMRKAGHRFQYVAVGEFGSKRARAHFHAVIYWYSDPPKRPMGVQLNKPGEKRDSHKCSFWTHGIVQYEFPRSAQGSAAYMMDYLDKDNLNKNALKASTNPAVGLPYMLEYARERARAGVPLFPNGPSYTIPGNKRSNGDLYFYRVGKQTAAYEKMLNAFIEEWIELRPNQRIALDKTTAEFLEHTIQNEFHIRRDWHEYFERNYEDYNEYFADNGEHTTYTLSSQVSVTQHRYWYEINVKNKKGETTWSSQFAGELDVDLGGLAESAEKQIKQHIRNGPPRLRKLLSTTQYGSTPDRSRLGRKQPEGQQGTSGTNSSFSKRHPRKSAAACSARSQTASQPHLPKTPLTALDGGRGDQPRTASVNWTLANSDRTAKKPEGNDKRPAVPVKDRAGRESS